MSNSVRPHRRQPTRLPRPWDSPGKNTGVGREAIILKNAGFLHLEDSGTRRARRWTGVSNRRHHGAGRSSLGGPPGRGLGVPLPAAAPGAALLVGTASAPPRGPLAQGQRSVSPLPLALLALFSPRKLPGCGRQEGEAQLGGKPPSPAQALHPWQPLETPPPSCSPGTRKQAPLTHVPLPGPWQHSAGPQEAREDPFEEGALPHTPHPTSGSGAGGWSLTDGVEDVGHLVVAFGRGFHEQQPLALCKLLPFLEEVTVESPH